VKHGALVQLVFAAAGVLCISLTWLKMIHAISLPWINCLSPIMVCGALVAARGLLIVVASMWVLGCMWVARSDSRARKSFTIRRAK
jgi:uncharacterized protein (DUF2062 family)